MIKNLYTLLLIIVLASPTNALACGCGGQNNNSTEIQQSSSQETREEKVQCPVMKTWILPSEAADKTEYNGKTYYFCCGGCKEKFLAEPEKYIESQS